MNQMRVRVTDPSLCQCSVKKEWEGRSQYGTHDSTRLTRRARIGRRRKTGVGAKDTHEIG